MAIVIDPRKIHQLLTSNVCVVLRRASLALQGAEKGDVADLGMMPGTSFGFDCGALDEEKAGRVREDAETWILGMAFHTLCLVIDLAFGRALECCALAVLGAKGHASQDALEAHLKEHDRFKNDSYPNRREYLRQHYSIELPLEEMIGSFRTIRNCLEHRYGVVSDRDHPVDGKIALRWRGHDFVAVYDNGEEQLINPRESTVVGAAGREVKLQTRLVDRTKSFALGETVRITRQEFAEVCFTAHQFGVRLATDVQDFVTRTLPPRADVAT